MFHRLSGKKPTSSYLISGRTFKSALSTTVHAVALPLPGFSELKGAANNLINSMKISGYNDDQCNSLTKRFERLFHVVQSSDTSQHPCLSDMLKQLHVANETFQKEINRQSRLGIAGAERRERILDKLQKELDGVVEETQLLMLSYTPTKTHWTDRVCIIPEHEITEQVLLHQASGQNYLATGCNDPLASSFSEPTRITARRGQFGKLPVIYKTYTSRVGGNNASKHPNIARVIGITQGYYGPNGIVTQAGVLFSLSRPISIGLFQPITFRIDGVPLPVFLSQSSNSSVLVRCIKGVEGAWEALEPYGRDGFSGYAEFTIGMNGHVSALPIMDDETKKYEAFNVLSLILRGLYSIMPPHHSNPTAWLTSKIFSDLKGQPNKAQAYNFLDCVARLGSMGLTELELMRLAVEHGAIPEEDLKMWSGCTLPPFIIEVRDIGQATVLIDGYAKWNALSDGPPCKVSVIQYECS